MTATIQYIDAINSPSGQTEYTFFDVPFGDESEERIVALCIETRKTGGGLCEILECTIGGVTAEIIRQRASAPTGTVNFAGIVTASVPTGTQGTVYIKFSLPVLRVGVQILNVTGKLVDSDSSIDEHPSVNFDIPTGGVALGCMSVASSSAFDWVGLTDVHRSLVGGSLRVSVGIEDYPAGSTNQTLGIQRTSGSWSGVVGTFAVWGPASDPPENLTPPSLSINEASFTGSVGLWDSMGAGAITYEWELRDSTDTVIDSGTGTSISGSGSFSGSYYLWVKATTSSGSEEAVSSLVDVVVTIDVEIDPTASVESSQSLIVYNPASYTVGISGSVESTQSLLADNPSSYVVEQSGSVEDSQHLTALNPKTYYIESSAEVEHSESLIVIQPGEAIITPSGSVETSVDLIAWNPSSYTLGQSSSVESSDALTVSQLFSYTLSPSSSRESSQSLVAIYPSVYAVAQSAEREYCSILLVDDGTVPTKGTLLLETIEGIIGIET